MAITYIPPRQKRGRDPADVFALLWGMMSDKEKLELAKSEQKSRELWYDLQREYLPKEFGLKERTLASREREFYEELGLKEEELGLAGRRLSAWEKQIDIEKGLAPHRHNLLMAQGEAERARTRGNESQAKLWEAQADQIKQEIGFYQENPALYGMQNQLRQQQLLNTQYEAALKLADHTIRQANAQLANERFMHAQRIKQMETNWDLYFGPGSVDWKKTLGEDVFQEQKIKAAGEMMGGRYKPTRVIKDRGRDKPQLLTIDQAMSMWKDKKITDQYLWEAWNEELKAAGYNYRDGMIYEPLPKAQMDTDKLGRMIGELDISNADTFRSLLEEMKAK